MLPPLLLTMMLPTLLSLHTRTFEVAGAAKALRGMWPLVFSKTEAVKEAVLDSWNILHLHSKTPKEQVGAARRAHCGSRMLQQLAALCCLQHYTLIKPGHALPRLLQCAESTSDPHKVTAGACAQVSESPIPSLHACMRWRRWLSWWPRSSREDVIRFSPCIF
jgi:hypothetical protein